MAAAAQPTKPAREPLAEKLVSNADHPAPTAWLTLETEDAHLVVEGRAALVRDEARLRRVADAYAAKYGWQVRPQDGAFDADDGAPTAGPPPYDVYVLTPDRVFGFGTDETWSPTRWRFP